MIDRAEQIKAWQGWFTSVGIVSFPLYGIVNGVCRCHLGAECRTIGKHPKTKGWRSLVEALPAQPTDNLGVSTDSLVIIDIDNGFTPPADLSDTFTVRTARGLHLWYWASPSHPIGNAVGWRPKIDIRSVGGLVAAPPSRHALGGEYEYVGGEIQPVPDIVLETQRVHVQRERADAVTSIPSDTQEFVAPLIKSLCDEVRQAQDGSRNHTLFRVLCRFFELAQCGWAGEDALHEIVAAAHEAGLGSVEITNTIESASRSLTR